MNSYKPFEKGYNHYTLYDDYYVYCDENNTEFMYSSDSYDLDTYMPKYAIFYSMFGWKVYNYMKYVYAPNMIGSGLSKNFIKKVNFCYTPYTKIYNPKSNNLLNKYLSGLIVQGSDIFTEFGKEYDLDEIIDLDLRKELKEYKKFNELFMTDVKAAETINDLIIKLKNDEPIEDYIIYNLKYLQMSEIIEILNVVSRKIF